MYNFLLREDKTIYLRMTYVEYMFWQLKGIHYDT